MVDYKALLMTAAIVSALSSTAFAMDEEGFRPAPIARQGYYAEKQPNFLRTEQELSSYFSSREERGDKLKSSFSLPLATYTEWPPRNLSYLYEYGKLKKGILFHKEINGEFIFHTAQSILSSMQDTQRYDFEQRRKYEKRIMENHTQLMKDYKEDPTHYNLQG